MSRPKPVILLQSIDSKTYKAEQVLQSEAIFAVFYDGHPINLRSLQTIINDNFKYKKCSFSNAGHAYNLRDKLRKLYHSDKFAVVKLTSGVVIHEDDNDSNIDAGE
jgi:hypothetical protein